MVDGSLIFLQAGQRYVLLSPGQGCVGVYHLRLVANHQLHYTCIVYCNTLQRNFLVVPAISHPWS